MNIGPIQFAHPFCQAGLAGYSDRAMRLVARRRGCPYAVTEALLDVILLSGGQGLKKSIDINDEDHPVAGQIIGSDADTMSKSAAILAERGYDVIDLNFACPVKKIKNKARGGHMLQDLPRAIDILKSVRDTLPPNVPTTVSFRRSFDDSKQSEDQFHQLIQTAWSLGYAAARVHSRTVQQKYLGRASWPILKQIKQQYPDQKILGSGDVFTAEDVIQMLDTTGVDAVWIARGAIGNPWIFQHAAALLQIQEKKRYPTPFSPSPLYAENPYKTGSEINGVEYRFQSDEKKTVLDPVFSPLLEMHSRDTGLRPVMAMSEVSNTWNPNVPNTGQRPVSQSILQPPSIQEQREALTEHFAIAMQIHGESLAGRRMRKMGIKYSRFHPDAIDVKRDFIEVHSLRDWTRVLDKWYATDAHGIWPAADAADEVNSEETGCAIGV
jgi:tRNA-dihydrouridine synthase B